MNNLKLNLKNISSNDVLLFFVAATFFAFPIGTAVPLITFACALAAYILSLKTNDLKSVLKDRMMIPVLLFVILPWVDLLYSKDPDLGLDYAMKTKYWLAVFLTAGLICSAGQLKFIIQSFWLSLSLGSVLAFFQFINFMPKPDSGYLGFGIVYTVLSMYLILGILMAAFYFGRESIRKKKILYLVLILLFVFHLSVLGGRNGYFVLALVSPLVVHHLSLKWSVGIKVLLAVVLVGVIFLSPVVQQRVKTSIHQLERIQTLKDGHIDEQFIRPYMYHQASSLWMKNPWLGIGTGSLKYYTLQKGHAVDHPHNSILYMGVSFGIPGAFVLLWIFYIMLSKGWRHRHNPAGFFVFCVGAVIFLGGIFETPILNSGTALLFPLGFGMVHHLPD